MKRKTLFLIAAISLFCTGLIAADNQLPRACTPWDRLQDDGWKERHETNKARIAEGNIDLLLIGDSIIHGWEGEGSGVLEYYYGDRKYINMAFGGDQTGNVLWRLNDAPMEKIHPKGAVLLIGINNLWVPCHQNPADVALGTKAIVDKLESLYPDIKILVLSTFFVGENPDTPERVRVSEKNAVTIDLLRDDSHVILKDINYLWMDESSRISKNLMYDFTHPTKAGYQVLGASIEKEIAQILGDTPKSPMKN